MDIDRFTTNEFKTLKKMYDVMITFPDGTSYVPLSQAEVAQLIGVSANTMSAYFKFYIDENYVEYFSKRKYKLTDKAIKIVKKFDGI